MAKRGERQWRSPTILGDDVIADETRRAKEVLVVEFAVG